MEKVNQIKAAGFFLLCLGQWACHPGAQWLELLAALLRHKGGTAYGLLESRWVIPSVPETIAFTYFAYQAH